MRITGANVFDVNEGFVQRDVYTDEDLISYSSGDDRVLDAEGACLIPGLTDLHFHGCMGADFSDGDEAGFQTIADYQLSRGVTQMCLAAMGGDEPHLTTLCRSARHYRENATHGATLSGIHLEGPFFMQGEGDGLQNPDAMALARLQLAAKGLIRLLTVAPELPGAMELIETVGERTAISIGHTNADYDTALSAFHAGARQVTHLYNGMPPYSHRAPGVVGAALDSPDVRVELICDGVHIHPSVVRATFRMFGADRVILVSNSMRATGMPDGVYLMGGEKVTVREGCATRDDGALAGSVADLMTCMKLAVQAGIPLADAVKAAAVNSARAIGIYSRVGSVEPGKRANMVLLDRNLEVKQVIFHGEVVQ